MRTTLWILVAVVIAALMGCVPSLHPLYTDQDLVFEEKLLGTWREDKPDATQSWEFRRKDPGKKAYELTYHEKKKHGVYLAHLVRLKEHLFIDLYPGKPLPDQGYHAQPYVPVHWFLRVHLSDAGLRLDPMNHSEMKKLLAKEPTALKHEPVEDGFLVTAPTPELQQFVLAHAAEDDKIFVAGDVLKKQQ